MLGLSGLNGGCSGGGGGGTITEQDSWTLDTASGLYYKAIGGTWTANDSTLKPLTPYLSAYWRMEDLTDSVSNNDLTAYNSPSLVTAKHNNGYEFNGSNQYLVAMPNNDFNMSNGDWGISLWWKTPASIPGNDVLFSIGKYNTAGAISAWTGSNTVFLDSWDSGSTRYKNSAPSVTLSTNTQYHYVVTRIGATIYEYLNNSSNGTTSVGTASFPSKDSFGIMAQYDANYYNAGIIDEIVVYKGHGLTSAEVAALYNSGTGSFLS